MNNDCTAIQDLCDAELDQVDGGVFFAVVGVGLAVIGIMITAYQAGQADREQCPA